MIARIACLLSTLCTVTAAAPGALTELRERAAANGAPLRVATYNLHSALGPGLSFKTGKKEALVRLRRIAGHLAAASQGRPLDAVALNEVDKASWRSGDTDQAQVIALELGRLTGARYRILYGETWRRRWRGAVTFGNALLTPHPTEMAMLCQLRDLPCSRLRPGPSAKLPSLEPSNLLWSLVSEPRGVIYARIKTSRGVLDVLTTHLEAFDASLRQRQAQHVVSRFVDASRPVILLGDLNAEPVERAATDAGKDADKTLQVFEAAGLQCVSERVLCTYPAGAPERAIDHIMTTKPLTPRAVTRIGARESDHHGLYAELGWRECLSR